MDFIRAAHTVCLYGQASRCGHITFCEALTRCDSPAFTQRSQNLVHFSAFFIYNASVEISLFQNGQWSLSFSFPTSPSLTHTHTHTHTRAQTKPRLQTHAHLLAVMLILMVINDITAACRSMVVCVCFEGWEWRSGALRLFVEQTVGTGSSPGWRVRASNNTYAVAFHPNTLPSQENHYSPHLSCLRLSLLFSTNFPPLLVAL